MKLQYIKEQAENLRKENKTYAEIGNILHISLFSARNMCSTNLGRILKWVANQKLQRRWTCE